MSVLTDEIRALPLPDGYEWAEDDTVFGAYHREWWHWFCYTRQRSVRNKYEAYYHDPADDDQELYYTADNFLDAAKLISAKMCMGLYE